MKALYKSAVVFIKNLNKSSLTAYSAQAAFFIIISFFPFFIFILMLLQYTSLEASDAIALCGKFLPGELMVYLTDWVDEVYTVNGTLFSVSVISALWAGSKGVLALTRGLNEVYEVEETRNPILLRLLSCVYTLVFAVIILIALFLLVFGERLSAWVISEFPALNDSVLFLISLRMFFALLIFTALFTLIFIFLPNRKTKFSDEFLGALLAAIGWLGFSKIYSLFFKKYGDASSIYGTMGTIVFMLLWMYFCMYIFFFGGEVNKFFSSDKSAIAVKEKAISKISHDKKD